MDSDLRGVQQPLAIADFIGPLQPQDQGPQGCQPFTHWAHLELVLERASHILHSFHARLTHHCPPKEAL